MGSLVTRGIVSVLASFAVSLVLACSVARSANGGEREQKRESRKGKAALRGRPMPIGITINERPKRQAFRFEERRERIVRRLRANREVIDDERVDHEAANAFVADCDRALELGRKAGREPRTDEDLKVARRKAKERAKKHDYVFLAAVRRTEVARRLRFILRDPVGGPPTSRRAMIAVAEKLFYGECVEIRGNLRDLEVNNDLAGWASDRPMWAGWELIDGKPDGHSEQAVTDALTGCFIHGKREKGQIGPRPILDRKDGVLDRQPPAQVRLLNARAVMDICALNGITEVSGRFAADGLKVFAPAEQRQSHSDADEQLLNMFLDCDFAHHEGRGGWRGWTLIVLTWLDAPDGRALVVGWVLTPASPREFEALVDLLRTTYSAWNAERDGNDPLLFIDHLAYDSEADVASVHWNLWSQFGCILHTPPRAESTKPTASSKPDATIPATGEEPGLRAYPRCNNPTCSKLGSMMSLEQADYFHDPRDRQALRLDWSASAVQGLPGQTSLALKHDDHEVTVTCGASTICLPWGVSVEPLIVAKLIPRPRCRYRCRECKTKAPDIRVTAANASRHGRAPKADIHRHGRPDLHAFSRAMLADRNLDEGINSELEQRGFGASGVFVPKWVSTPRHIRWFCYARLLTVNLRRLVEADGMLAATQAEADELGHLTARNPGPEETALLVSRNGMEFVAVQ